MERKKRGYWGKLMIVLLLVAAGTGILAIRRDGSGFFYMINDYAAYQETDRSDLIESYHYYYRTLDEDGKRAYTRILEGLYNEEEKIRVYQMNEEEIGRIVDMVMADHPELFHYNQYYEYISFYHFYTILMPEYAYTGEERKKKEEEIRQAAKEALQKTEIENTEYETIKGVFEYLVDEVDYVEGVPDNQNVYSALVNGETVCAGYARAAQYLLQLQGIETLYVTGVVEEEGPHAWNIVKCDEYYYHLDLTYGDRLGDNPEEAKKSPQEFLYDYNYLCCTDEEILKDRTMDSLGELPKCSEEDKNYYIVNDIYYEDFSQKVMDDLRDSIESGEPYWECKFSNKEDYEEMLKKVRDETYHWYVINYLNRTKKYYDMVSWYSYDDVAYTISCWYSTK